MAPTVSKMDPGQLDNPGLEILEMAWVSPSQTEDSPSSRASNCSHRAIAIAIALQEGQVQQPHPSLKTQNPGDVLRPPGRRALSIKPLLRTLHFLLRQACLTVPASVNVSPTAS